ncbi:hypothetical protein P171DRAFT_198417 [Karstenula rhodostoma CBS 690.94]|uniref:Uncharacterized protein n=1 Tax=Karstenula rhodostoma CBS 690.94 TaxID=1392251 RepID=A0A9P4PT22_9PLEO|nr:hypothetical protein P171DRAFT_198417 [Karstenula rhodostoma CBS 690.94]
MVGRVLALSALVALGHSKAIVTNNCRKDVYIWSVPEKADLPNNLSISPGKRYEEPWRSGTSVSPGISIKVSTEHDGIYTGKSEINLQYDVDASDPTKIWIDLATVRGNDFDTATLNTCYGGFKSQNVSTQQCSSTDDVELVLCGSERTVPSQDSTPIHVISNCIGLLAEREDPLHPRMCSGRVVGPKRMPMLPDEQEDDWLAERVDTVPLKIVMRHEAAKHAASQDAEAENAPRPRSTAAGIPETFTEKSTNSEPLCKLFYEVWPNAQCDERMAHHNLKLFYQDNCGEKTRNMFSGISCEAIRHQIEQIYPDVAVTPTSVPSLQHQTSPAIARRDHVTMCINPYYMRFRLYWGQNSVVKSVLNNQVVPTPLFSDRAWTSDEEVCQNLTKAVRPIVGGQYPRRMRCVKPYCDKGYYLGGDCSDVEDELELLSKDAGFYIDWTTDDDACFDKRAATERRGMNSEHKNPALAPRQAVDVSVGTDHRWNDIRKVCITTANEKLGKYWGDNNTEAWVFQLFPGVRWTADLDDCSPQAIAESLFYHHKLIDKKQGKEKKCVVGCLGKTCKRVKKELNKLSKDVGENWSWTDDEKLCTSHITIDSDGPEVGKCVMGEKAVKKLWTYWDTAYEDIMDEIFPEIDWTSDEECEFAYDTAAKKWFNDRRVKGKRVQRCVTPYCTPFNADCSDVEDQLEEVSKNLGLEFDWTSDDDACPQNVTYPVNHVLINENERAPSEHCILAICRSEGIPKEECEERVEPFEETAFERAGVRLKLRVDGPACQGPRANEFPRFPRPIQEKTGSHKLCRRELCRRSNQSDHDCQKVEHDVRNFFNKTMQIDVDFSDNHDICDSALARASLEEPTTYAYNTSTAH